MKKKLTYYYSALLLAATLAGCSNELGDSATNPGYLEPDAAAMQLTVGFPQPKGYAVGDEDVGAATDAEKEIKSLAFFVKTSHTFAKFYSDELLFSPNGFTAPLTEVAKGSYTATVKVRSVKFLGDSEVIAVANYKEHGLDFTKVTTLKQLKAVLQKALDGTQNLATPLLMLAQDGAVALAPGAVMPLKLDMIRSLARLDVVNNAIDVDDPTDDFTLTSVRLLNAPAGSNLLPDLDGTFTGINLPLYTPAAGVTSVTTYLYETPNDAVANQPSVEIKGRFRGSQLERIIPFKTADKPGVPGVYFAIQRNYRYQLTIGPAGKTEEPEFTVKAKEWEADVDIEVKPSIKAPKLEKFVWGGIAQADLATQGITWDEATRTLTLTQKLTADITLAFEASAYQSPKSIVVADPVSLVALFTREGNVAMDEVSGYATGYADGDGESEPEPELDPDANDPMPLRRTITFTLPKDVEALVAPGSTTTNLLKVLVSESYATDITVVYVDKRTPPAP